MQRLIIILLAGVSLVAQAMFVFDPSNLVQNTITANNSIQALLNQATMIKNQVQSITMESENLKSIPDYQWREVAGLLQEMDTIARQGQSLSYNMKNLDAEFQKLYPNYSKQPHPMNYQEAYQKWNATSLTTMQNSLQSIGLSMNQLKNEESTLKKMKAQSQTATGRMQVMQVSNEVAFETIRQLQSLQRVMAVQANSQTAYMAHQVSSKAHQDAEMERLIANLPKSFEDDGPGFGEIKMP